jgi:hypothetical protein
MIRYQATVQSIQNDVRALNPEWLREARRRTARFRRARRYREKTPIWSVVKPIFMKIQKAKCAYCERTLESGARGKIEWDVEHYRPKTGVGAWPNAGLATKISYQFSTGRPSAKGYYLLPYNLRNYVASCKVCNSSYKQNYFPIASARRSLSTASSNALRKEKAYLPYPIGVHDEDPERILTFRGFVCVPAVDSGHRRRRALVTIELLGLNDRDVLMQQRAGLIVSTWAMLERLRTSPADSIAARWMQRVTSAESNHANCARSFVAAYQQDRAMARAYVDRANHYLDSKGGSS